MRSRITIQKRIIVTDDSCNDIPKWNDYYSCYASVSKSKTDVSVKNAEQQNFQAIVFQTRSCKKIENLINNTKEYRVIFKDTAFKILSADNYGYTHDKFSIEVVRYGNRD